MYENVLAHVLFADSAQPRKASNVTRPFPILWVGSGDEITPRRRAYARTRALSYKIVCACVKRHQAALLMPSAWV